MLAIARRAALLAGIGCLVLAAVPARAENNFSLLDQGRTAMTEPREEAAASGNAPMTTTNPARKPSRRAERAAKRSEARASARTAIVEPVAAQAAAVAEPGFLETLFGTAKSQAPVEQPITNAAPAPRRRLANAVPTGGGAIRPLVARHAAAHGIPASLAHAIVMVESRGNPRASNAGNYGLMQIRLQTARGVGYSGGAGGLLDAETNAKYGMIYLAQAYRMSGGDTCRTIMKYQSGHGASRMSGANRAYCAKVKSMMGSRVATSD